MVIIPLPQTPAKEIPQDHQGISITLGLSWPPISKLPKFTCIKFDCITIHQSLNDKKSLNDMPITAEHILSCIILPEAQLQIPFVLSTPSHNPFQSKNK